MDLLKWDQNGRLFVFHINYHLWPPLLSTFIQVDHMIHTVGVTVFLQPFQFMPTGLMNTVDIILGTQYFLPLKFLSDY